VKPQLKKPTKTRQVTETGANLRVIAHCRGRGLLAIRRTGTPLGPIFLIDVKSERVVLKNFATYGTLAQHLGLLQPWEVAG
jgi:hypothetical protein